MSSLSKWMSKPNENKVLLLGNKGCGKTAFIDRLKYNVCWENTSHTKTVNVEAIEHPKGYNWTFWEIGASGQELRNLLDEHLSPDVLVVYLHDCCDQDDQVPTLFSTLLERIASARCRHLWLAFNRQDFLRRNRKDTIDTLSRAYEKVLAKYQNEVSWKILTHKLSPEEAEGTCNVLDDIFGTVRNPNDNVPYQRATMPQRETALKAVVEREISQDTKDIKSFWTEFEECNCTEWSHYNFLKVLYVVVFNEVKTEASCLHHADSVWEYAKRLEKTSPQWINYIGHRTRTIFWVSQMHYAVRDYQKKSQRHASPQQEEFEEILRKKLSLMDTALWEKYFSISKFNSPAARREWVRPDRKALPLVQYNVEETPATPEDPDRLLRYAFGVLQYVRKKGLHRVGVTARALASLEKSMMRRRRLHPLAASYSKTQGYFWLQLVQVVLQSLYILIPQPVENGSDCDSLPSRLTFSSFKKLTGINDEIWRECYSKKAWDSLEARTKYIPPDIKPVDNLVASLRISEENHLLVKQAEALQIEDEAELPSTDELTFRANLIVHWSRELDPKEPVITSHAHLLSYLYTNLVRDFPKSRGGTMSSCQTKWIRAMFREISGPLVDALTHRNFWVQQALAAVHESRKKEAPSELETFADFVVNNLDLANEDLAGLYYSMEIWHSDKAREMILPPDKKEITTILELDEKIDSVGN